MNKEFAQRRQRFMEQMGEGVALIPTNPVAIRSNDTDYPYRPDSTFWYLTGFCEPDAVALLAPGHPEHRFVLFVNPKDPAKEVWTGRRAGVEGAVARYGADAAYSLEEMDKVLPRYLENAPRLYYTLGHGHDFDQRVLGWLKQIQAKIRQGVTAPDTLVDPAHIVHEMRLFKGPEEIDRMRKAASIGSEAHRNAMASTRPGVFEYELQAEIEYTFRKRGSQGPSYNPICGSGPNSCILHYNTNDRRIEAGDLVLVDAGCEYDGYASDITRTFPATGIFSPEQRAIYQLVLDAQKACIEMVRPGTSFQAIHDEAVRLMTSGLIDLGLVEGPIDQAIARDAYKPFYMHKTGHWLGMDVHDVGRYRVDGQWRTLSPGMVLTVEPGLYIAAGSPVDPKWFDIGVRIEDDVLVTESGYEVLSAEAPKEVAEIEALMGSRQLVRS